jgi:hypothetical protein
MTNYDDQDPTHQHPMYQEESMEGDLPVWIIVVYTEPSETHVYWKKDLAETAYRGFAAAARGGWGTPAMYEAVARAVPDVSG